MRSSPKVRRSCLARARDRTGNPTGGVDLNVEQSLGVLEGVSAWDEDIASLRVSEGLSLSAQTITVQVIDGNGETGEDSITISIDPNESPTAEFLAPSSSVNYASGISLMCPAAGQRRGHSRIELCSLCSGVMPPQGMPRHHRTLIATVSRVSPWMTSCLVPICYRRS